MAARVVDADPSPGIVNILKAVYEGTQVPIDAGLRIETRYFFNTARSPEAKTKIDAFFASRPAREKASAQSSPAACPKGEPITAGKAISRTGIESSNTNLLPQRHNVTNTS